jgi:hypothetical protein
MLRYNYFTLDTFHPDILHINKPRQEEDIINTAHHHVISRGERTCSVCDVSASVLVLC